MVRRDYTARNAEMGATVDTIHTPPGDPGLRPRPRVRLRHPEPHVGHFQQDRVGFDQGRSARREAGTPMPATPQTTRAPSFTLL